MINGRTYTKLGERERNAVNSIWVMSAAVIKCVWP